MYPENTETLSISLPAFFVHFINGYITTHEKKSPSLVIQDALQLLYEREQGRTSHLIQKQANISSGRACIANTRLTVWNLVASTRFIRSRIIKKISAIDSKSVRGNVELLCSSQR